MRAHLHVEHEVEEGEEEGEEGDHRGHVVTVQGGRPGRGGYLGARIAENITRYSLRHIFWPTHN